MEETGFEHRQSGLRAVFFNNLYSFSHLTHLYLMSKSKITTSVSIILDSKNPLSTYVVYPNVDTKRFWRRL